MYVDIDVHHGDGVEEAFYLTNRVMTVSFHKYGNYFPGTGNVSDVGQKDGTNYAVNIPLKDGMTDDAYKYIFEPVGVSLAFHAGDREVRGELPAGRGGDVLRRGQRDGGPSGVLQPDAARTRGVRGVRATTGPADAGAGRRRVGVRSEVERSYTIKNVSRTWSYETAVLLRKEVSDEIPYNNFIEWYAPTYKLHLEPSASLENKNSMEYLDHI